MASSNYAAWSVVAGEQPTTAKWNILGTNDAAFNTGQGLNDGAIVARHLSASALGLIYPIGAIYTEMTGTNPSTTFGFGTWVQFGQGQTLIGQNSSDSDFATAGNAGGSKTHWHWQTFGNDGGGVYMAVAGAAGQLGANGQSTVITVDRTTFGSGSRATAGARFDGTGTASSMPPYITVYFWRRTA